eukprot:TRINITY_DN13775_c0_g1_i3.p1 TRINITY_DN13775_c0_g1~~TRINITY_DN13775_c0_g1_i3.p1  ORF type:complete len:1327 (+),score=315.86 TRINITY_DN13775_c0_g1_i3:47-3982(+)
MAAGSDGGHELEEIATELDQASPVRLTAVRPTLEFVQDAELRHTVRRSPRGSPHGSAGSTSSPPSPSLGGPGGFDAPTRKLRDGSPDGTVGCCGGVVRMRTGLALAVCCVVVTAAGGTVLIELLRSPEEPPASAAPSSAPSSPPTRSPSTDPTARPTSPPSTPPTVPEQFEIRVVVRAAFPAAVNSNFTEVAQSWLARVVSTVLPDAPVRPGPSGRAAGAVLVGAHFDAAEVQRVVEAAAVAGIDGTAVADVTVGAGRLPEEPDGCSWELRQHSFLRGLAERDDTREDLFSAMRRCTGYGDGCAGVTCDALPDGGCSVRREATPEYSSRGEATWLRRCPPAAAWGCVAFRGRGCYGYDEGDDLPCNATLPAARKGWCQCTRGRQLPVGCGGEALNGTCEELCAARHDECEGLPCSEGQLCQDPDVSPTSTGDFTCACPGGWPPASRGRPANCSAPYTVRSPSCESHGLHSLRTASECEAAARASGVRFEGGRPVALAEDPVCVVNGGAASLAGVANRSTAAELCSSAEQTGGFTFPRPPPILAPKRFPGVPLTEEQLQSRAMAALLHEPPRRVLPAAVAKAVGEPFITPDVPGLPRLSLELLGEPTFAGAPAGSQPTTLAVEMRLGPVGNVSRDMLAACVVAAVATRVQVNPLQIANASSRPERNDSAVVSFLVCPMPGCAYNAVDTHVAAVRSVIRRVCGVCARHFDLELQGPSSGGVDEAWVSWDEGRVRVRGTSPVALAHAAYQYLKSQKHMSVTWGRQGVAGGSWSVGWDRGNVLGKGQLHVRARGPIRYYYNVVTFGYTTAWWGWDRWEAEIDWMALHGINTPLAHVGQEYIWREVLLSVGLTDEQLQDYWGGAPFLPWQRMGNVDGWGGPLPRRWMAARHQLQLRILARMRELGMSAILPAFSGHVPPEAADLFPNVSFRPQNGWNRFSPTLLVDPGEDLFRTLASTFTRLQQQAYGTTSHLYSVDTFNEMEPDNESPEYLRSAAHGVIAGMKGGDPQAKWVLQGWMFVRDLFWRERGRVEAYLSGAGKSDLIVLDLTADTAELSADPAFHSNSWVWCMLHNYGGRPGMYGDLPGVQARLSQAAAPANGFVGAGLSMEATERNYVLYEFVADMAWTGAYPSFDAWLSTWVTSRYGVAYNLTVSTWKSIVDSLYTARTASAGSPVDWGMYQSPEVGRRCVCRSCPPFQPVPGAAAALRELLASAKEAGVSNAPRQLLEDVAAVAVLVAQEEGCRLLDAAAAAASQPFSAGTGAAHVDSLRQLLVVLESIDDVLQAAHGRQLECCCLRAGCCARRPLAARRGAVGRD